MAAPPRPRKTAAAAPEAPKRAPRARKPAAAEPACPTTAYARQVVAGSLPAGPYVRDACARHLRDMAEGPKRGLTFDREAAARAFGFFRDVLKLNGGEHEGQPFHLLSWQQFIVGSLFGWKTREGVRRFRMAFVLTGKGSGKSPLAAGIGLYCLVADQEPRAEVYAAASKRDQAAVLFRDAVAMFRQSPALSARLTPSGGRGKEWNLAYLETGSFFRCIASDEGQSGPRPHCALLDEIHEHHDNTMVEMLRAGTKGRRQALIFMITNAEADRTSVCAQYRDYSAKVCRGEFVDDTFFAYVAALDTGDDPFTDESCWAKPNPSLGHTFQLGYLREQVTQARGMPSKEAIVRRLNFCEPTDAAAPWIDRDLWTACESDFDPEELAGLPCWLGLDLSQKRDLTALAAVWKRDDGRLFWASWFWTPGDTLDERARGDNVPYRLWRDQGHLYAPPGRLIDKRHVAEFVQAFVLKNNVQALAFDQAQIDDFLTACDDIGLDAFIDDGEKQRGTGLRMIRHGQGFAGYASETVLWMPRSVSALEEAIINGTVAIRCNPVLTWNSGSAVLLSDPSGNRKWDKRKATGRIDGMVAGTMATGAAQAAPVRVSASIWDRPELWV